MDLEDFINVLIQRKLKENKIYPDKLEAEAFIEELFHFLFVVSRRDNYADALLNRLPKIKNRLAALLAETEREKTIVKEQAAEFFSQLPGIYQQLMNDAESLFEFDPAAQDTSEVIMAYPGFYATVVYRFSHQLWRQGVKLLPRLFSEHSHGKTGIDIHPGATIGKRFVIDHGTGIVIGETATIGDDVKIYQGVTLGALHVQKSNAQKKRHPTIENNVVIYSGATILGGDTVIGKGSIIGGNVWLTHSIPSNSVVYHKSEIKIKDKDPFPEPLNFII